VPNGIGGVPDNLIAAQDWNTYKIHIVTPVIDTLNGDSDGLGPLRRVIQETLQYTDGQHLRWLPDADKRCREAERSLEHLRLLVKDHDAAQITKEESRKTRLREQQEAKGGADFRRKLAQIKDRFVAYHADPNTQRRGYALEEILHDLFLLFELHPRGPFKRTGEQIDGAFMLDRDHFLLEAKWQTKPVILNDLRDLDGAVGSSLDNTLGLFVSLNGFSEQALSGYIQGSRPRIVCMDGQDLMAVKPWYQVVAPREDLREGKPLDASEFAVHLDQVRDGRAHDDYQIPERFFAKTFPTTNLTALAGEVVRRLSGIRTQANAVFNMTTQFGGGKTHALTLLYHLAKGGPAAKSWSGVDKILEKAEVKEIPYAEVGVFVGTEFDSLSGRGGKNGEPLRRTPWGELAWQIGGKEAFKVVAEHEKQGIAPSAEVIRKFLPKDKPTLILMDELMNYVSRNRKSGLAAQLYNFLQNLSEEARGQKNVVLCASIPASEFEMNAEDHADYDRFKKLLDRLGKPVIMSAETETSEIIRRRLFDWDGLTRDAEKTIVEYAEWTGQHRNQMRKSTWLSQIACVRVKNAQFSGGIPTASANKEAQ
jgi:hypothetical protein